MLQARPETTMRDLRRLMVGGALATLCAVLATPRRRTRRLRTAARRRAPMSCARPRHPHGTQTHARGASAGRRAQSVGWVRRTRREHRSAVHL